LIPKLYIGGDSIVIRQEIAQVDPEYFQECVQIIL
jgi:hypothetical protein